MNRLQMVVGLCFDEKMEQVALVLKAKGPPCVVGNWNGVGGKIEPGEFDGQAMVREFYEETGCDVPLELWRKFASVEANDYDLHFFFACTDRVFACKTVEVEKIELWNADSVPTIPNLMHNIRWMVPFLRDRDFDQNLGHMKIKR